MPLCKLLYTSEVADPAAFDAPSIARMAQEAAARNRLEAITGGLVFVGSTFIQVLEGTHEAVEQTFERVCCDFRHDDLKLIDLISVQERQFAPWCMGFLSADEDDPFHRELEHVRYLVSVNARSTTEHIRNLLDWREPLRRPDMTMALETA